jgi:transcriptional regulator with XRE-family HTH domain
MSRPAEGTVEEDRQPPSIGAPSERDYSEEIAALGSRLRQFRYARQMSLEELAEKTGLSIGLLSQLERGIGNPAYVTLRRIVDALHIRAGQLVFDTEEVQAVIRKDQRRRTVFPKPGVTTDYLTPVSGHVLQALWVRYEVGLQFEEVPLRHEGEEVVVLVRGTLEIHVGDQAYMLHEGDSILFDCSLPHWYHNPGPEPAEIFSAMTPPAF